MITIGDIVLLLKADDDQLDKDLDGAKKKSEGWAAGLGSRINSLLGGAVLAGIGALTGAVVGIGKAAFDAAMMFDDASDTIAIATGATGDELATLEKDFETVFTSVPTDADTAAQAVGALNARLGVTGEALTNIAIPLTEASRLMGGDVAGNAELLTRAMGDWGVSVEDGAGLLDKFFVASQETGVGMDSLMSQVVQFGAPLRLMGFGLDESIALFGKWGQEGVNAELVMGSLRIAAGNFADAGIPLNEGLMETMGAIQNAKTESEALAIAMEVFGARAGPDMAAAIREGRFSVDELTAAIGLSEGAVMATSQSTADFGEMWTVTKNKVMAALEPVGVKMLEVANLAMEKLGPYMAQAGVWISDNLLPVLEDLWEWLSENVPPAMEKMATWWEEKLKPALETLWNWLELHIIPLLSSVATVLGETLKLAFEALAGVWTLYLEPALSGLWDWLVDLTGGLDGIGAAIDSVTQWFKDLGAEIMNLELPDWLTPGSPTPLELGIDGIRQAMRDLANTEVVELGTSLTALRAGAAGGLGGGVVNNYNLNANFVGQGPEDVGQTLRLMEMMG